MGLSLNEITNAPSNVIQTDVGQTYATMTFSGNYPGIAQPSSVSIRLDFAGGGAFLGYTALSGFTSGSNNWSGTLHVPQGAWLLATAQDNNSNISPQQANEWGIGLVCSSYGQSNAGYFHFWGMQFTNTAVFNDAYSSTRNNNAGGGWAQPMSQPPGASGGAFGGGYGGTGGAAFYNSLRFDMIAQGLTTAPIGMNSYAVGGQPIAPTFIPVSGADYVNMSGNVTIYNPTNKLRFILWAQGESDATAANAPGYAPNLASVVAGWKSFINRNDFLFGISTIGDPTGAGSVTNAAVDTIRGSQYRQSQQAGCIFLGSLFDLDAAPPHHGEDANGYPRMGYRAANAIGFAMGTRAYGSQGPKILSANWADGTTTLNINVQQLSGGTALQMADGSSPAGGIPGLVVTDITAATILTISNTAFSGAALIVLTMAAARVAGHQIQLTYATGLDAIGQSAFFQVSHICSDNNGIGQGGPLAGTGAGKLNDAVGFPLQSTYDVPITVGNATGTISQRMV